MMKIAALLLALVLCLSLAACGGPGMFFTPLRGAYSFDSRTGKKRHTPDGVCLFW